MHFAAFHVKKKVSDKKLHLSNIFQPDYFGFGFIFLVHFHFFNLPEKEM